MLFDPKREQRFVLRQQIDDVIGVIKHFGWTQYNLRDERGVCPVGAIQYAAHTGKWDNAQPLFAYLTQRVGDRSLAAWNDTPGRTKRQVFAFLRSAQRAL